MASQPLSLLIILIASCMSQMSPIRCRTMLGDETNAKELAALPAHLADRLSPLSSSDISRFTTLLSDGSLAQHSAEFCRASGIMCRDADTSILFEPHPSYRNIYWSSQTKTPDPHPTIYRNIYWSSQTKTPTAGATTHADEKEVTDVRNKHVYFREKELVVGSHFLVDSLANPVPARSFLPKAIASKLPFSTSSLPQLTHLLSIPTNSYLSKAMTQSLQQCETQRTREDKMCATSMEDMLQFAKSMVLHARSGQIQFLSSDTAATSFPQTPTFQQVALKVPANKPVVVCHDVMFPFSVYSCHQVPYTKVYEASWTTSGELVRAAAVCHMNTTGFDPTHPAFAALYIHPGDGREVCHWVNQDNFVISQAN